ncbi:MAG: hypothetical protein AB7I30_19340 [Isosphaeraceae bacterium]
MSWSFSRVRSAFFLSLLAGVASPFAAVAADLSEAIREARSAYAEFQPVYEVYLRRTAIHVELLNSQRVRANQDSYVRQLRIRVDSLPSRNRGNNLQREVHDELLMARQRLAELDHYIEELRANERALDEMTLIEAEAFGKGPRATDRRRLLPEVQRLGTLCDATFHTLRQAAGGQGVKAVRDGMRGMSDSELGPPGPFLKAFDSYLRNPRLFKGPSGKGFK